jgi:hypothetical protein
LSKVYGKNALIKISGHYLSVAKEFLDGELKRCEWELADKNIRQLYTDEGANSF